MDHSSFNPDPFLDATMTEPTEKRPPLPVGDVLGRVKLTPPRVVSRGIFP